MSETDAAALKNSLDAAREACAAKPLTIPQAIHEALWMARTPDGFVTPTKARDVVLTLLSALQQNTCYLKAMLANQEVFVLRQHDLAAIEPMRLWAELAERHGASQEKVGSARTKAQRWDMQPRDTTRWPT